MRMLKWWAVVVGGAAAALLFAWLGRLAGVPLPALLAVGGGVAALMWTVVLVTVPWNLYFEARQVLRQIETSRERGIGVPESRDREARLIARRTRWLALGGHVGTAAATAVFAWVSGHLVGYWLAAFYLISTAVRPAAAFLKHLRQRLWALRVESTFPPDDVEALRTRVGSMEHELGALRTGVDQGRAAVAEELGRLRVQAAAERDRIEQMARRIESALDGMSDHQELLTGIRALVRMIRTEPA
ncbi:hypothetical protein [Actinoplanes subtropicus]|uniref:hypothetical protein n=1 Tax=Actinoplanes subtropicus TaxID=543632 RepID=UPI0004C38150|nr:hypothetical protein [Actinoplanes subtropicus]